MSCNCPKCSYTNTLAELLNDGGCVELVLEG